MLSTQQAREFTTLLSAGIPIADAWEKSSAIEQPKGKSVLKSLRQGSTLAISLKRFNLVTEPQRIYIAAAENAGTLSEALLRLATESEQRLARRKQLASRLGTTYFLLFIGWSVAMVLAVADSSSELGTVFFINIGKCLLAYLVIRIIASLCFKDSWWWLQQFWNFGGLDTKVYRLSFVTQWLDLLARQLAAGVDASSSLKAMQGLIRNAAYRKAATKAIKLVQDGQSLSLALTESGLVPAGEIASVLVAAETSGNLGDSLAHQASLAETDLNLYIDHLMFWVPKLLCALCAIVALSMAFGSGSGGFVPDL
jgi:type II secretory pathway component PulF